VNGTRCAERKPWATRISRALRAFMATIGLTAPAVAPAAAAKTDTVFRGIITHVTGDDLEVRNQTGQTVGVALVSKALHVFESDRSTVALNGLPPGQDIKVIDDRTVLLVAHGIKNERLDAACGSRRIESHRWSRLRRFFLAVGDQREGIRGGEPPDRARTVRGALDRAVGPNDEIGRVQERQFIVVGVEAPEDPGHVFCDETVADGIGDGLGVDHLLRIGLRVDRRDDDADARLLELRAVLLKISQLLMAERSPLAAIDEENRPRARRRHGRLRAADRLERNLRHDVAAIERRGSFDASHVAEPPRARPRSTR